MVIGHTTKARWLMATRIFLKFNIPIFLSPLEGRCPSIFALTWKTMRNLVGDTHALPYQGKGSLTPDEEVGIMVNLDATDKPCWPSVVLMKKKPYPPRKRAPSQKGKAHSVRTSIPIVEVHPNGNGIALPVQDQNQLEVPQLKGLQNTKKRRLVL